MSNNEISLNKLEKKFSYYFIEKAPFHIPDNAKENITKYSPWITLVIIIFAGLPLLGLIGIGSIFYIFDYSILYIIADIILIVSIILQVIAIPGLITRKLSAWRLLYYSTLLYLLHDIVSFISYISIGSLLSSVLITIIILYTLFQIKICYN